jgi:hypothetical protein
MEESLECAAGAMGADVAGNCAKGKWKVGIEADGSVAGVSEKLGGAAMTCE